MFRGILVIVGCGNIHHIMAGKRGVSVEAGLGSPGLVVETK